MNNKIANIARQGITCIKNAANPYFNSKYADLATVVAALNEPLKEEGLGYRFSIESKELETNALWSVCMWVVDMETSDEKLVASFPITTTDPQKFGSCVTYAKRYMLTTVFNVIAEEDDDGNAASAKPEKRMPSAMAPVKKEIFF